ncbi:Uncharacterized protein TCM_042893 [Theobroma cacao]|uniref:Uncharacterized protein n=1 Tax=Theobroma cacao TaxID=3641 RepID=A0A061FN29_THECC|nr:Uncharacterized protein TCM_042893 [Theobroma cacao]
MVKWLDLNGLIYNHTKSAAKPISMGPTKRTSRITRLILNIQMVGFQPPISLASTGLPMDHKPHNHHPGPTASFGRRSRSLPGRIVRIYN